MEILLVNYIMVSILLEKAIPERGFKKRSLNLAEA